MIARRLAQPHFDHGLARDSLNATNAWPESGQQRDAVTERTAAGLPAERALEWLRALGESLQATQKSKEKADVMHAIYDRITGRRPRDCGCPADAGGLRARTVAGTARKRLKWRAPQVLGAR